MAFSVHLVWGCHQEFLGCRLHLILPVLYNAPKLMLDNLDNPIDRGILNLLGFVASEDSQQGSEDIFIIPQRVGASIAHHCRSLWQNLLADRPESLAEHLAGLHALDDLFRLIIYSLTFDKSLSLCLDISPFHESHRHHVGPLDFAFGNVILLLFNRLSPSNLHLLGELPEALELGASVEFGPAVEQVLF